MRSYEVLKTFKYSSNGIKIVELKKGGTGGIKDNDIDDMIKAGYIKEVDSKKNESSAETSSESQEEEEESNDTSGNKMLLAMDKDHIEKILRHYGFELDKRKSLRTTREDLIKQVLMNNLKDPLGESKQMVQFYEKIFGVKLEPGDKTVDDLVLEMAAILESVFSTSK